MRCKPLFRADFRVGFELWRQDLGPDVAVTHTKLNLPTHRALGIWRQFCTADKPSKQKLVFFFKKNPDLKNSIQDETSLKVLVMHVKCFGVNNQMKTMTQKRRLCHCHFVLYCIYWSSPEKQHSYQKWSIIEADYLPRFRTLWERNTPRSRTHWREEKTYKFVNFKPKGRRSFGKPFVRWEINMSTETLDSIEVSWLAKH
jgi:hypothetical protein